MEAEAIAAIEGSVDGAVIAFARVGTLLTVMPGLGGARVSMRSRLALGIALAVATAPLVPPTAMPDEAFGLAALLVSEMAIGLTLGLLVRVHYAALRFAASGVAAAIGFQPLGGVALDGMEPDGPLAAFAGMGALMLMFAADLHHLVLRGIVGTYALRPPGTSIEPRAALAGLADALVAAYGVAHSLAAPFLVYGLVVQAVLGLLNKLAPAVPLYFVGLPLMIGGGLVLLALAAPEMLAVHAAALARTIGAS